MKNKPQQVHIQEPFFGPTGDYPRGKLSADDDGGLQFGVAIKDKTLIIHFGVPTTWIGLPKDDALAFADMIRKRAEEI